MRTLRKVVLFPFAILWVAWEWVSFLHLRHHTKLEFNIWLRLASSGVLAWTDAIGIKGGPLIYVVKENKE